MKRINPDHMTREQFDELVAAAEEVTFENTRPLTPADRRLLARAARKAGRPRVGAGAKRINVTVEQSLLRNTDAYARIHGVSRAAVVAEGLRRVLAA
jgi:hypothetical protein